ncbi:replication protein [Rodentibacter caecimuris]|nr:replication protein [Rodentibacter heylii]
MMSNVVRIEELRLQQVAKQKTEQQGAKKVSVDDGFTAIPNELLKAILRSKVLGWKGSYLLATILKTLSWHKESDWFTHSQVCEMMNIEPTKYHINQLSAARKELIKERVLFESGKKTGVNLDVFKWEMVNPEKVGSSRNNRDLIPEKVGNGYPEKVGNTKETITKEKINTPIIPQGENLPDGKSLAKSPRRVGEKINFDQIAECWNSENENRGGQLPFVEKINDKRKRAIKKFLGELKAPTAECAANYFRAFFEAMKPHHWGENDRGWRANFDFAIRADIVLRVREEAL